jgi:hypothetical protein
VVAESDRATEQALERLVEFVYGRPKGYGRTLASQLLSFLKGSMRGYQFAIADCRLSLLNDSYFVAPRCRSAGGGDIEPVVSGCFCNQDDRLRTMHGIRAINADDLMSARVDQGRDYVDSLLTHNRIQKLASDQRNLVRVCLATFHLTLNRHSFLKRRDTQLASMGSGKNKRAVCLSAARLIRPESLIERQESAQKEHPQESRV